MKVVLRCPPELRDHLPEPIPARRGLPDWLKAMPTAVASADLGFEVETVKQCPPFIDAMTAGFLMPLAADVRVHDGAFSWDWDPPVSALGEHVRSPLALHVPDQLTGTPFHDPDAFAVKFVSFWTIELPKGWGLLCTHPANRPDLPFRTVTGLVHADSYDRFIHFPALWTDPGFDGVLPAGTPVAQCYVVPHEAPELELGTIEGEAADRFHATRSALHHGAGAYRRHHRKRT